MPMGDLRSYSSQRPPLSWPDQWCIPIAGVAMADSGLFGCPRIAKKTTVQAGKRRISGKETEPSAITHD
jgi:hypothetical protein